MKDDIIGTGGAQQPVEKPGIGGLLKNDGK